MSSTLQQYLLKKQSNGHYRINVAMIQKKGLILRRSERENQGTWEEQQRKEGESCLK